MKKTIIKFDFCDMQNYEGVAKSLLFVGLRKLIFLCISGVIVFEKPCGVVVGVREIFGSESKKKVYAHLHSLLASGQMNNIGKVEAVCL